MRLPRQIPTLVAAAVLAAALAQAAPPAPAPSARPPVADKRPAVDTYHGVPVRDDYRWLENWDDPAVRQWSEAQNAAARAYLDSRPGRDPLAERVRAILTFPMVRYYVTARPGLFFALKSEPPKQQPYLVTLRSLDDPASERVVLDPNQLDPEGLTAIDFYVPSADGRRVAVSMSKGGSERGDLSVYEVATGKKLADVVPHVNGGTAGGSLAWNADGSGFYYTRYPRGDERAPADMDFYQQVWFHKLGTPTESDTYSIGKDFPRIAEIELRASEDGRAVLARVENGDGGDYAILVLPPGGTWTRVARFEDEVKDARFGRDGQLYLLSRKGAPRGALLRVPPGDASLGNATVVVPQGEGVIQQFVAAESRVYVSLLAGGPSELRAFGLDGKPLGAVPILPVSTVGGLVSPSGDELFYLNASYTTPPAWYRCLPAPGGHVPTKLVAKSPVDLSGIEVLRETAVSKDGTKVPMTILRRKEATKDGTNPALLYGYGGFGLSTTPGYDPTLAVWFERGGVLAFANLRGGGEFGEAWHRAGNLSRKQNVFDDFAACAQRLVELKITTPARLAIVGGSNGGLLMGAELTQHPEMFRAVVSYVGIYDMLRVETQPNGAFNVTEYGTVKDPALFKALHAYSPYHQVKDGVRYPAVLMLTGANDPRVDPSHSRKFTARLQVATSSGLPVLLRTSSSAGHGIGSSLEESISEAVDQYSFLFDQLGMGSSPKNAPRTGGRSRP